ncbi:FadR family transcriptional regulator [Nocardia sp. NEAU-351]|uniref:FadR family transcriptional regulator n=2 Tax=Nocardia bovistercoris TaxID=2785916 RepID=A0A931ICQ3_9NOCA|nr:FCD domain-containing protein [Nocardia bovistercoris]MBH0778005.1 FadR family transcriptional regulator [Nocardia bovistercoris]
MQVAAQLRTLIVGGDLNEGESLGTEAGLRARFDVSRPSLREALRILEADGLISIVRGALGGVIVRRPDQRMTARAAALVLQSRSVALADVFDASAVIEPAAVRMVAIGRGHRGAANRLRDIVLEQKRTIDDPLACTDAMIRFHSEIILLAGNQTLILVCEMLNEVIARAITDVLTRGGDEPPTARRRTIRSHERLIELIAAGDGDAAQTHWNNYMAKLRGSLLGQSAGAVIDPSRHR